MSRLAEAFLAPVGEQLGTAIATGLVATPVPPAPLTEAERLQARAELLDGIPVLATAALGGLVGFLVVSGTRRKNSPQGGAAT